MLACFFCYTKLKQCCQLLRKCLKAEEVFAQMLNGNFKQIPLEFQGEIEFYGRFIKTPIEQISIDDNCRLESGAIGEQLSIEYDLKDGIEPKEEYLSDEVEAKYLEDSYIDRGDIPSHHFESDSEDDVPLMMIKTEVEEEQVLEFKTEEEVPEEETTLQAPRLRQSIVFESDNEEVPQKKIRALVSKQPELDIWKAKLEDTITDKQKKSGPSDSKIFRINITKSSQSVTTFREPILSDTIVKSNVINSNKNKDETMNLESLNQESVTDVINTAVDTNSINSYEHNVRCKILNASDDLKKLKLSNKPYNCLRCQRSFTDKSRLNAHIRVHTGEQPYKCSICQRSFTEKHNLKSHIRIHTGEKPYKCHICQRSFTHKYNLKPHIRIHTGEQPYKCEICQRSFTLKHHLKSHIEIHTGKQSYKCDICQRSFTYKHNLKSHIRIHTGEQPYKCDICQRSFSHKYNLKSHIRLHTVEQPYKCDICQRNFINKSNLNKHIRTHTGEQPYKCDICQRSFTQNHHLKSHIYTHS